MECEATRRSFLQAAGMALSPAAAPSRVMGAGDRVRVGVIGTGGRGKYLIRCLKALGTVDIPAVCDVYDVRRNEAAGLAGPQAEKYLDYREVLDRKDIDAVVVATLDNNHAPIAIAACRAGKDVYVEKPMVHKPQDGLALVAAARADRRIVQVGVQQRTGPHYVEAKQRVVDSGMLGPVALVRTWCDANIGYTFPTPAGMENKPAGLDWDRYLGPLPRIPWDPQKYFSPFKFWDFGGGQIMGVMIHVLDNVHWYLGLEKPLSAVAGGGIYRFRDGRDTPDVVSAVLEYPQNIAVTFEGEVVTTGIRDFPTMGMEFHGPKGILTVFRDRNPEGFGYEFVPNPKEGGAGRMAGPSYPAAADPHLKNWLDCIRTRRKPAADEVAGYYGSVACYMANLAWREKTRIVWNPEWDLPLAG